MQAYHSGFIALRSNKHKFLTNKICRPIIILSCIIAQCGAERQQRDDSRKENMDNNNLDVLQKTMLFKGSSMEELQLASGLFQERLIKSNTTIFTEKMPAEALYIVKSGNVRISVMAGEGEEKALLLLGPGDFFGELALLQEGSRMVTARSETAVELLLITRKDFQALMDLDPRTASRMLLTITTLLAMRVKAYNAQLKDMLLA